MDDPYLWLEEVHGAKALGWVKEQNEKSLAVLKADPRYQEHYNSILQVLDAQDRIPLGVLRHGFVFNFWQDANHPKGIWRRTSVADYARTAPSWEVLLDLDKLAADEKENWVWKGADCTPSLSRCLISLSRGGGDAVVIREFDLPKRAFVADGFRLAEAKSSATWLGEDSILFGTDFGKGSMTSSGYPRIVKLWYRGTPVEAAKQVFEGETSDVASQAVVVNDEGKRLAFITRAVGFFASRYFYLKPGGPLVPLPLPETSILQGVHHGQVLVSLRDDWKAPDGTELPKGALFSFALEPLLSRGKLPPLAVLYLPDARASIEQVSAGRDAVYASIYENVTGSIYEFRFDKKTAAWRDQRLELPDGGSTHIISADDFGPDAQFTFESYLKPTTLYAEEGTNAPKEIKSLPARFDSSELESEQFEAVSKDGTRIPYFVVRSRSLKGPAPTVLYGYGGFEISLTPAYSANFGRLWLTKGGVYVVANIRGGGEFGPAWHNAALKENRQKAYDDFQAVAADLIARKITIPAKLAIMGGSNGGLLVSATMVERPELFGAVVCQVPLIDMIRYTQIGAGASWAAEYGDPADPNARAWILKYSPYQNVRAAVKYPPVFFVTATSDDRVTPVHARKMAARMMEQGHDVTYYENTDGGHAAAADHRQAAEMWALSFVYLKRQLGLE